MEKSKYPSISSISCFYMSHGSLALAFMQNSVAEQESTPKLALGTIQYLRKWVLMQLLLELMFTFGGSP